jgi:hypothetical protein
MWDLDMRQRWWTWIGIVLIVWLFEQRLLHLFLLVKDLDAILELREPCSLSVYMLPSGFNALSYILSSSDNFLFLMESHNLLLSPG